jgi:hypothetical protein
MRKTPIVIACLVLCCSIVAGRLLGRLGSGSGGNPSRAATSTRGSGDAVRSAAPEQPRSQQAAPQPRPYKVVHVFVALCDNKYQGIVPVPAALGNGQDPQNNLYWGAMYGVKTFLRKSPHWARLKIEVRPTERPPGEPDGAVLERCAFKSVGLTPKVYVIAEAWDGRHMKAALLAFLRAAAGSLDTTVVTDGDDGAARHEVLAGGWPDMVCFVGHNGLMDARLSSFPESAGVNPDCAVVLACKSRDYFVPPLTAAKCRPLITTTGLMAPEAYTLDAIIRSWANGDEAAVTRRKAGSAYAEYQQISQRAAGRLFATQAQ